MVISATENKSGKRARQLLCLITKLCPDSFVTLCTVPARLLAHGMFLGKNSGSGLPYPPYPPSHSLLYHLPCRWILYLPAIREAPDSGYYFL